MPVAAAGSLPAIGSVSCAEYLWQTIVSPPSARRTCQKIVLPDMLAYVPPARTWASTVSRAGADQYSSWPTPSTRS